MPNNNYDFNTFLNDKADLVWRKLMKWRKSDLLVWSGYKKAPNGTVSGVPSYFAYVKTNPKTGMVGVTLAINDRFNVQFDDKGWRQTVIDQVDVGQASEIDNQALVEVMGQRYGINQELDFTRTPVAYPVKNTNFMPQNREVADRALLKKTLYNKEDQMVAVVILRKITYLDGSNKYAVSALAISAREGLKDAETKFRTKPAWGDAKDGMADFHSTTRQLRSVGFADEMEIPDWATADNFDFELGMSKDSANKVKAALDNAFHEPPPAFETFGDQTGDISSGLFGASFAIGLVKSAQDTSQYYSGPIPDPDSLEQYVGTSNVEASQIRSMFNGVDDALKLVNQFDSSLLTDVAFIYNFSSGGAYGVYMSALDEKIKDAKLKKVMKTKGYEIQEMPNGSFYATHKQKDEKAISDEIQAIRQQLGQTGATTFGINMNKVVSAAKADATESNITDQNDQRWLGVLHLGATMVHEAVHSKGSHSEGPSEQAESKFMAWAMPIINEERKKAYQAQNRAEEFNPLTVDPSQRRMASASNWLHRVAADGLIKESQYGAQFLHNQELVNHFGPAPWSSAFWSYGKGPIEEMLGSTRAPQGPASNISLEGHLRQRDEARWASHVDAGTHTEELLEESRQPLVAYKAMETLMEDSREKPLLLPVSPMKRKAAYDSGDEAFGTMCNLVMPMEDRVQEWDNDEDAKQSPNKNLPRYQPEYGNQMSKEDGIMTFIKDLNTQVEEFDSAYEERTGLKTSPWQRAASDKSGTMKFIEILEEALRGISQGRFKGTRLVVREDYVPMIAKFFSNDLDIKLVVFKGNGPSKVWIVAHDVAKDDVVMAEHHLVGEADDDASRDAFEKITHIGELRSEAISRMIGCVRGALRDAEVSRMLVLGDLPLAVVTGIGWDAVRSVDFCCEDSDACLKLGEIACDAVGAEVVSEDSSMLVARWRCVTFRFFGDCAGSVDDAIGARGLTSMMLAFDILTEKIIDVTGDAAPDVEAGVIRAESPNEVIASNPLVLLDAIYLASKFGFAIDEEFVKAAADAEFGDVDVKAVWNVIKEVGKGKSIAVAEEYGLGDALSKVMGE